MKRILLRIAYDGTAYHGFQVQEQVKTVEGELRRAISALTNEEIELLGGSRTDAGVHALDNVAVFDTKSRIEAGRFPGALNARLPEDIRVTAACEVPEHFHPRHCPTRKTYEYRILYAPIPVPTLRLYTYPTRWALDTEAMRRAAALLCGEHDFKAFSSAHAQTLTSVRTIDTFEVIENPPFFANRQQVYDRYDGIVSPSDTCDGANDGNVILRGGVYEITLRVTGNGFLYNMVRILAGTLVEVGRGRILPEEIPAILESGDRTKAGPTLPPQGLCLVRYEFEGAE